MQLAQRNARRADERGATMTVFGVLLAFGVVMGMAAMTIDVGAIMLERRHLQNGADAAALALADACARDADECDPTLNEPYLDDLLDANSGRDDASQLDPLRPGLVNGQCGRVPNEPAMPGCPTTGDISDLHECVPLPSWLTTGAGTQIPYVETYSRTDSAGAGDSPTVLPKFFSRALFPDGGDDVSVNACARAAWGPPQSFAATVPVTFSTCEWEAATSGGTDYVEVGPSGAWPGYGPGKSPWPDASKEVVINLHSPTDESSDCTWNGKDTAGGFGYIREADGSGCSAEVTTDGWTRIDTGNSVSPDCTTGFNGMRGTVINIPVFDCMLRSHSLPSGPIPDGTDCDPTTNESGGANTYYHIAGWAKFYLSGYKISGTGTSSVLTGSVPCSGGDRCLSGWFLEGALQAVGEIAPPDPSNPDFGTYIVRPAG